ncbi:MAG: hypothetical protein ACUVWN_05515 [bacterium]
MEDNSFKFRVTCGWLRDLASEPTPYDKWPCIRWDEKLLEDQIRFLDVQREVDMIYNVVWGLFINRSWPVPFENVVSNERKELIKTFVNSAHERNLKILSGVGIYSWGFDEVIEKVPGVSSGHRHAMCAFSDKAWDWQRRILDFLMDPKWGLDGVSMQSADQGRCNCEKCSKLSPAEHHAKILVKSAEYIRKNRPDWVIGQASWGLRVDDPNELDHIKYISTVVDYIIEVQELSAELGIRKEIIQALSCAFGSVGGVFVEPPQHWDRLRWFVPCGLSSAQAIKNLWHDGGNACEYFYRPFANPVEEVSWRTGAITLKNPNIELYDALSKALSAVYEVDNKSLETLTDWFSHAERAYFSRSNFKVGNGPLSLEPLIWHEDPFSAGPPIYLKDRMSINNLEKYAKDLKRLKSEILNMKIPNNEAVDKTIISIDGTLNDISSILDEKEM